MSTVRSATTPIAKGPLGAASSRSCRRDLGNWSPPPAASGSGEKNSGLPQFLSEKVRMHEEVGRVVQGARAKSSVLSRIQVAIPKLTAKQRNELVGRLEDYLKSIEAAVTNIESLRMEIDKMQPNEVEEHLRRFATLQDELQAKEGECEECNAGMEFVAGQEAREHRKDKPASSSLEELRQGHRAAALPRRRPRHRDHLRHRQELDRLRPVAHLCVDGGLGHRQACDPVALGALCCAHIRRSLLFLVDVVVGVRASAYEPVQVQECVRNSAGARLGLDMHRCGCHLGANPSPHPPPMTHNYMLAVQTWFGNAH